ncbi:MAG: DUF4230 domain-containing protein [Chthoniobacterales bacterium]|nr:DUF4230 domain-containing protein [Chthoniobacterales bacterium]
MQLQTDRPQTSAKRFGFPLALVLIVLILALLGAFLFYRAEAWPGRATRESVAGLERIGRAARDGFVRLAHLQPRVTVNNRLYLEQTTTIAQLALLDRQVEVEHEMLHSWAGSTKRIKLHGTFAVKAGFDLRKKFSVNVSPKEVLLELPHAEILSVEQRKVEVLTLENGLWNRVSPNDIEHALAALPALAREKSRDLPGAAEQAFTRQFLEKFHPAQPVHVIFPAPSPAG